MSRFPPRPMPPLECTKADDRMLVWIGVLCLFVLVAFAASLTG